MIGNTRTENLIRKYHYIILVILSLCVVACLSTRAQAAFSDRDPDGSIEMPGKKTLEIEEGRTVKINFGTKVDSQSYYFYKIKASKTGYIKFMDDYSSGNCLTLCSATKNVISKSDSQYDDWFDYGGMSKFERFINYGVKKGKVYYIRVKGASTKKMKKGAPYVGSVRWSSVSVKAAKYGKGEKGAVKIKAGKMYKGLFIAASRKAQWFKIKAGKKKKIRIRLYARHNCGSMLAQVRYKSKGNWKTKSLTAMRSTSLWKDSCTVKFDGDKAGPCYVKVYPSYKESGMYKLKWK